VETLVKKATIASTGVVVEDFYFLKMNQHVLNEKLYVQKGKDYVWQQVDEGVLVEGRKSRIICIHFPPTFPR
jgi:hypothetical protein